MKIEESSPKVRQVRDGRTEELYTKTLSPNESHAGSTGTFDGKTNINITIL
ncbi:MAG TPA: hypothetical protein VFL85_02465 [Candidatus Saccharimonadales bacterium]|nr:hypothetical protein [Candidatus Saccharimonadales bacterium]